MFEKLKEYGLYIVLSLIALGALAYAFLSTSNAQKGGEVVSKIQDTLVTAIAKNEKVKNKSTIVNFMGDLKGLTIGSYKLDNSKVTVYNVNGDTIAVDGEFKASEVLPTPADGNIQLVMLPNKKIGGVTGETFELEAGKVNSAAVDKTVNEQLRGFMATGYVGFGTFDSDTTAKEFRDSYFSTGMLVKDSTDKYAVMIEIAR